MPRSITSSPSHAAENRQNIDNAVLFEDYGLSNDNDGNSRNEISEEEADSFAIHPMRRNSAMHQWLTKKKKKQKALHPLSTVNHDDQRLLMRDNDMANSGNFDMTPLDGTDVEQPLARQHSELTAATRRASNTEHRRRQPNPAFLDVERTGKWGVLYKLEIIVVLVIVALVALGLVLYFTLSDRNDNNGTPPGETTNFNSTPTMSPILSSYSNSSSSNGSNREIDGFALIKKSTPSFAKKYQLPTNVTYLLKDSVFSTPQERAAKWLLYDDPANTPVDSAMFLQKYALMVLYHATGGSGFLTDAANSTTWKNSTNWGNTSDPCGDDDGNDNWYGVTCSYSKNQVHQLDLTNNGLISSALPAELLFLTQLEAFYLGQNSLSGPLPIELITYFKKLVIFNVANNDFTGTLPAAALAARGLDTLSIQGNDIKGNITTEMCDSIGKINYDCADISCPEDCTNYYKCECFE